MIDMLKRIKVVMNPLIVSEDLSAAGRAKRVGLLMHRPLAF
jgi:hypothetical protein